MIRKKILVLLMALILLLNMITGLSVCSAETAANVVRVRVEGKNQTLFDREITVTDEVYGLELLQNALGENNMDYTYYESFDSYFIEGLLGETGETGQDYSLAWKYYAVKGNDVVEPGIGVDKFELGDTQELVFYMGASDSSWQPLTRIPMITVDQNGGQHTITVTNTVYNAAAGEYDITPLEDVDVKVSYVGDFATDDEGRVAFEIGKGIYRVDIKKADDYPQIVRQHLTIEGEDSQKIKDAVEDLKDYYKQAGSYSFREAAALNHVGRNVEDFKDIASKFSINETQSAAVYAGNIIGMIAAGHDPQEFVDLLVKSQTADGKFVVAEGDGDYPTTLAYAILALDMAKAQYGVEKAVKALLNEANAEGHFGDVDTTAMCITALANHKDITGVPDIINASIQYLKTQQLDTGGFEAWGAENPYSIAAVIQGLIANNINPLDSEWIKNGNTMLDALLSFKVEDHFEYTSQWGTDVKMATEQAFAALADLYNAKSMYQSIRLVEIQDTDPIIIERVGTGTFKKGYEAPFSINIKNNDAGQRQATIIVALFEKDTNKMLNYTYLTRTLASGEQDTLTGGFLIPETGEYEVRAFVWDNLEDMNTLADPLVVEVE